MLLLILVIRLSAGSHRATTELSPHATATISCLQSCRSILLLFRLQFRLWLWLRLLLQLLLLLMVRMVRMVLTLPP